MKRWLFDSLYELEMKSLLETREEVSSVAAMHGIQACVCIKIDGEGCKPSLGA